MSTGNLRQIKRSKNLLCKRMLTVHRKADSGAHKPEAILRFLL